MYPILFQTYFFINNCDYHIIKITFHLFSLLRISSHDLLKPIEKYLIALKIQGNNFSFRQQIVIELPFINVASTLCFEMRLKQR